MRVWGRGVYSVAASRRLKGGRGSQESRCHPRPSWEVLASGPSAVAVEVWRVVHSGCTLQVELENLAESLEVGFKGNREFQAFGSSHRKNGAAVSPKGRARR